MLILTEQIDDVVMIGDDIEVRVIEIAKKFVRLWFTAPTDIPIHREKVYNEMIAEHGRPLTPDERRHNDEPTDTEED